VFRFTFPTKLSRFLFCRGCLLRNHKRKVELAAMTPVKALKAGADLMMWTLADDATWVTKCHAATERLKAKEVAAKAGASTQEGAGVGEAARGPE
jgi:hypothetical protein